jgi:hypothetical protein
MDKPVHRRPGRTAGRPPLPDSPLTTRDAAARGWTPAALRHAVAVGEAERPQRGTVRRLAALPDDTPDRVRIELANLIRAQSAALQCPRAVISHLSAAIARGMPIVGDVSRSCLTVPSGTALRRLAHVHLHRAMLTEADVELLAGDRVTSASRTVMDVAREFGVSAGVVAADFALHTGLVTESELQNAFEVCRRWPGRTAARITLLSADGRAESPLESVSRLRITRSGLPAPKPQQEICDWDGRFLARCDFYWDEYGVFGEVDGLLKYREDATAALSAERARHDLLEATGLVGVRWGWPDLSSFDRVVRRLQLAFGRGLRPGSPARRWGLLVPGLHA